MFVERKKIMPKENDILSVFKYWEEVIRPELSSQARFRNTKITQISKKTFFSTKKNLEKKNS